MCKNAGKHWKLNDYTIYVQYRCKYIRCLSWQVLQSASFPPAEASLSTSYRGGIQCSIVSQLSQYKFLIYWIFFCLIRGNSGLRFSSVRTHRCTFTFKLSFENDLMYIPCTWRFRLICFRNFEENSFRSLYIAWQDLQSSVWKKSTAFWYFVNKTKPCN